MIQGLLVRRKYSTSNKHMSHGDKPTDKLSLKSKFPKLDLHVLNLKLCFSSGNNLLTLS